MDVTQDNFMADHISAHAPHVTQSIITLQSIQKMLKTVSWERARSAPLLD